jgi:hypothetical protein
MPLSPPPAPVPIWIARKGLNASGEAYVTIECAECLRAFPQVLGVAIDPVNVAGCIYCGALVRYAIALPGEQASVMPPEHKHSSATPGRRRMQKHFQKISR